MKIFLIDRGPDMFQRDRRNARNKALFRALVVKAALISWRQLANIQLMASCLGNC